MIFHKLLPAFLVILAAAPAALADDEVPVDKSICVDKPAGGALGDRASGTAVAGDASTLVVGAPDDDSASGSVTVYVRSGTTDFKTWSAGTALTAPADVTDFGSAVALGGSKVAAASEAADGSVSLSLYTLPATTAEPDYTITTNLVAAGLGRPVALALTADTLLVGVGASAEILRYTLTTAGIWELTETISPGADITGFGTSLSLSGSLLAVGAPGAGTNGAGEVYLYEKTTVGAAVSWAFKFKLVSPTVRDHGAFGTAVAVGAGTVAVGEPGDTTLFGRAYVFYKSGSNWLAEPVIAADDRAVGDQFGSSIAVSSDLREVIIGQKALTKVGAAYVFARHAPDTAATQRVKSPLTGTADGSFGAPGVPLAAGDGVAFAGDPGVDCVNVLNLKRTTDRAPRFIKVPPATGNTLEANTLGGSTYTVTASLGDDDGEAMLLAWTIDGATGPTAKIPAGTPFSGGAWYLKGTLSVGEHTIKATLTNNPAKAGLTAATFSTVITVTDTAAPVVQRIIASPPTLPHSDPSLRSINLKVNGFEASDRINWKILSVYCNEGSKTDGQPNWRLSGSHGLWLRGGCRSKKHDRVYVITVDVWDDAGQHSQGTARVTVPHKAGKSSKKK